jgi:peptide/nickel transport system ATP-binding protein
MSRPPVLRAQRVKKSFQAGGGFLRAATRIQALGDVSLQVEDGSALGLVGESGCGKSTLARCLLRLVEPDAGTIFFEDVEITALDRRALRTARRNMQMIFQDPYASLNPRMTVSRALSEPLGVHGIASGSAAAERVRVALDEVGLPADSAQRFPHEFSGGQRQRIGIARALILEPRLIVADEPVSALDVSVQAQVLKVLQDLRERRSLSMLFVSHDLGVVRQVCERVAVMYLGRIVEVAPVAEMFDQPLHPYTALLRSTCPVPDPAARISLPRITGEVPSAAEMPPGCAFHPRCPRAMPICSRQIPALATVAGGRSVACFLHHKHAVQ